MAKAHPGEARVKRQAQVLIVDDEEDFLEICSEALERTGAGITTTTSPQDALRHVGAKKFDLVFADQKMPEMDGVEFLERALAVDPELSVVLFTGYPTVESAVRALRIGAKDYLTKPFTGAQMRAVLGRVLALREEDRGSEDRGSASGKRDAGKVPGMICGSPAMLRVLDILNNVADLISTVFITGETGTGKGLLARVLHERSRRRSMPFVAVNCSALPESLLESELFGYERGAFTGATAPRLGLIESADGGTLFLDEISEMPLSLQPKLLDVLQERKIRPVGCREDRPVDFRLVVASNSDPERDVDEGRLRQDLYFRINVVRIELPPLRERREDIPRLAQHFVDELSHTAGGKVKELSPEAIDLLHGRDWPGNVRELRNFIERALPLAGGPVLTAADLEAAAPQAARKAAPGEGGFELGREAAIRGFEEEYIKELLQKTGGNVAQACRLANIPRNTFYRHLHKYSIQPERFKKP